MPSTKARQRHKKRKAQEKRDKVQKKRMKLSFEALLDTTVKIKVGLEQFCFEVHKGLLSHYSSYFRAALSGPFKEGNEGVIILETEEVEVFRVFFKWLYKDVTTDCETTPSALDTDIEFLQLLKLYVFSDKRGIPRLGNAVLITMREKFQASESSIQEYFVKSPKLVEWSYKYVRKGLPLHAFLVDTFAFKIDDVKLFQPDKYPQDFICAVLKKIFEGWRTHTIAHCYPDPFKPGSVSKYMISEGSLEK
ncbi:MAG: hypothetical protein M1834_004586 [Cirrosporium novae-zelandiae]|nr:MAG: hypothetical protein M1834_004586 [Cirrosporium novae-zelandiae]